MMIVIDHMTISKFDDCKFRCSCNIRILVLQFVYTLMIPILQVCNTHAHLRLIAPALSGGVPCM